MKPAQERLWNIIWTKTVFVEQKQNKLPQKLLAEGAPPAQTLRMDCVLAFQVALQNFVLLEYYLPAKIWFLCFWMLPS